MDNKEHIDKHLHELLSDASMDAPGIDWKAFSAKRKKRRAALWWFILPAALLIGGLSFRLLQMYGDSEVGAGKYKEQGNMVDDQHQRRSKETPEKEINDQQQAQDKPQDNVAGGKMAPAISRSAAGKHQAPIEESVTGQDVHAEAGKGVIPYEEDPLMINLLPLREFPLSLRDEMDYTELSVPSVRTGKGGNKFFLQVQAGPAMNFPGFKVSETGQSFIHKAYGDTRSSSESGLPGYGFQALLGVSGKRTDLAFGIGLSNTIVNGRYDFMYSERPVINPDGRVAGYLSQAPSAVRFNSRQNYTFVEFPLRIDYRLMMKNRLSISAHGGMCNQFLQDINGELPNALFMDMKDVLNAENFRTYSASFELGARLAYHHESKLQFALTPLYRKNLGFYQVKSYYRNTFNAFVLQFSVRTYL